MLAKTGSLEGLTMKIISDGTAKGTKVFDDFGRPLQYVRSVTIDPLQFGLPVSATIRVLNVELDIEIENPKIVEIKPA